MGKMFKKKWMMTLVIMMSFGVSAFAQGWVVSGIVVDEDGEPLVGVSVVEKGTNNKTSTDVGGRYTITVSSPRATLVFSYIGMITEEIPVDGRHIIDVVMKWSDSIFNKMSKKSQQIEMERMTLFKEDME